MLKLHNLKFFATFTVVMLVMGCDGGKQETQKTASHDDPMTKQSHDSHATQTGAIRIGKLSANLPSGWVSVPPSSTMRKAQIQIPAAEGDPESGQLVAFYFGPSAGGVEANIKRWYGQFEQPDGKPTQDVAKREELESNEMKITLVQFTGTMKASNMPGAPSSGRKENWMNVSAIVQTPEGPWFFKGTGPENTMQASLPNLHAFLNTLKYSG